MSDIQMLMVIVVLGVAAPLCFIAYAVGRIHDIMWRREREPRPYE